MNDMVMAKIKVSCEIKMYIWRRVSLGAQWLLVAGFIWRETGSQGNSAARTAQTSSTTRAQPASCCRLTQPSHREIPQHCLPFLLQDVHREWCYHSLGIYISCNAASPLLLEVESDTTKFLNSISSMVSCMP